MHRRLVPASVAAALLLTGLTACSTQQEGEACTAPYAPGVLSDGVVTFGEIGQRPEVTVPSDVSIKTTQRTVIATGEDADDSRAGDGEVTGEGSLVGVNMLAYDSATGQQLYESQGFTTGAPEYVIISEEQPNPITEALRCTLPGDRVVLALSPEDSAPFGTQLGLASVGSVVFVADVLSSTPMSSEGRVQGLPSGFPAVVTNDEGRPGVVLPPRPPQQGISSAERIEGDGATVSAEDSVVVQVLEVGWDGTVATNTWESGAIAVPGESASAEAGFSYRSELTGHPIGSQLVIVENQDGQQRVLVVDLLATL